MKSTFKWGLVAFGISLISTIVYGQARTPFTRPAYITTPGTVTAGSVVSNGSFNSTVASGNQAFTCTNVGCRLSLGNTGRYLVDDGTNLEFIAPVQATTFEATTASGSSLTGGGASGPLLITSNTPDSATSTSVPAVRIRSSEALTAGDAMFQLLNASNVNLFQVTAGGETQVNGIRLAGNILQGGTSEFIIYGQRAATSTVAGTRIGNATQPTVDGGKLASIVYFSGGSWVDAAHFSKEGLLRVNAANGAKPTCNADNRGRIFFLDGASGVADIAEICGKDAANVYAWKAIATF